MREGVARLLSDRWTVETAADGEAALAAARICNPALVITDVVMPKLDGYALLRALRADASTRDIPVVLLSAHAGEEAHFEALEADANDYLVKPFSAGELRARVEAQLLRSEIRAIRAAHDRQLAEVFRHAPVAVALLRGSEHVFDFANDEYMSIVGRGDLVGKTIADALPELAEEGLVARARRRVCVRPTLYRSLGAVDSESRRWWRVGADLLQLRLSTAAKSQRCR